MAFEKIHRPLFAESKHVDFPNNNSVSTSYNGAFCKVRGTLLLSRRLCNYLDETAEKSCYRPPCPGGGVLPYINYISMCRSIGWGFWAVLVWKRVYTLPILVESGVAFEGTTGVYDGIYRFNSKLACVAAGPRTRLLRRRQFQMSEKEREICEFEMDLKCFLVCALF